MNVDLHKKLSFYMILRNVLFRSKNMLEQIYYL